MSERKEINTGTPVLYYNQWTGLDTKIFIDQFSKLTKEEIRDLKQDDVIYVDIDSLHPQGKVYGWIKVQISAIVKIPNNELRIYYMGGNWKGFKTTKERVSSDIYKAVNEDKIARILTLNPLTKQIFRS